MRVSLEDFTPRAQHLCKYDDVFLSQHTLHCRDAAKGQSARLTRNHLQFVEAAVEDEVERNKLVQCFAQKFPPPIDVHSGVICEFREVAMRWRQTCILKLAAD